MVVIGLLVSALFGYSISWVQTPVYEATTTIYIGRSLAALNVARQDIQISEQLVLTYADLARRQPILRQVISTLKLPSSWQKLKDRVRARSVENTQLLEIVVRAGTPAEAQQIANTLTEQLIQASTNATSTSSANLVAEQFVRQRMEWLRRKITWAQQRVETLGALQPSPLTGSTEKASASATEVETLEALLHEWDNTGGRCQCPSTSPA